ncbi:hypothetical protein BC629DRAFT_1610068 [Irpex lacteus]|nr:hypothetical protein BC629DRAFT_1610068 [Irpex lacteus]
MNRVTSSFAVHEECGTLLAFAFVSSGIARRDGWFVERCSSVGIEWLVLLARSLQADYPLTRIGVIVEPGGYFLVTSCNFTKEKLIAKFARDELEVPFKSRLAKVLGRRPTGQRSQNLNHPGVPVSVSILVASMNTSSKGPLFRALGKSSGSELSNGVGKCVPTRTWGE